MKNKKFHCQFACSHSTVNYKWLVRHMWDFHSILPAFCVNCGISGCVKKFTNHKSFLRHIKNNHPVFHAEHMKEFTNLNINNSDCNSNNNETLPNQSVNENDCTMSSDDERVTENQSMETENLKNPYDGLDFDNIIAEIFLELREEHHVLQIAISAFATKLNHLLHVDRKSHSAQIKESLKENLHNLELCHETEMGLASDSPFKRPIELFSNGSNLDRYISQKKKNILPLSKLN